MIFKTKLSFSCFSLPPILLHPLSTTSCHYFSRIHARVHKSPICHDIWWTRQGLQESGPVWGCDLVSSLSASGSTGTEGRKGWRKGERGGTASVKGWELGAEEVGGWIHAAVWPWRQTGSPEIRGVINLSVEPANPTAPRPGNLAWLRRGQGWDEQRKRGGVRERNEGREYALLRVICPVTSFAAGQVMKHNTGKTYDYCHCFLARLPLSTHSRNLIFGALNSHKQLHTCHQKYRCRYGHC